MDINDLRRVRERLRIAGTDGVGAYMGAIVCLGVAALFGRAAWSFVEPRRQAAAELRTLMTRAQEPLRDDRLPTFSALVVGDAARWTICKNAPEAGHLAEQLATAFELRYQNPAIDLSVSSQFPLLTKFDASQRWKQAIKDASLPEARPVVKLGVRRSTDDAPRLDSPLEEGPDFPSSVRIPSFDAALFEPSGMFRAHDALVRSRSLESLGGLIGATVDGVQIASIYFISVDGMLRTVPQMGRPLDPVRTYVGASYVWGATSALDGECENKVRGRYDSKPYLDALGNGIVATVCSPVGGNTTDPTKSVVSVGSAGNQTTTETVGVLCVDNVLPREFIHHTLSNSHIYDISLASVLDPLSRGEPRILVCGEPDFTDCTDAALAENDPSRRERLRGFAGAWRTQIREDTQHRGDSEARNLGEDVYGVTVWRDPVGRTSDVALVRLSTSFWDWSVATLTGFSAILVMVAGGLTVRANINRAHRREVMLVSSLQTGVLHVDANDIVIEANDRAQELLGLRLPRFGVTWGSAATKSISFGNLISKGRILDDGVALRSLSARQIDDARKQGDSSSYYARTTGKDQRWLRFSGSPIRTPSGETESYGVVEPVPEEVKRRLDDFELKANGGLV